MNIDLTHGELEHLLDVKTKDCDPETRCHCPLTDCSLYDYCVHRVVNKKMIRKFCYIDCMNRQRTEVRLCPSVDCPFYPYRMGRSTNLIKV